MVIQLYNCGVQY